MTESIHFLDWDSKFFGRRVGSLNIETTQSLECLLREADKQEYKLLYVYSPMIIKEPSIHPYAIVDVGGHVHFAANLPSCASKEIEYLPDISEYQQDILTPELLEIALLSGHVSRFRTDPSLPSGSFERLYEIWLLNTLQNRPQAAVYTYLIENRIAGMISASWHDAKCSIGLLAVAMSSRGQGIGSKLIRHVKDVCMAKGGRSIEVKTQLSNTQARAFYLRNSFTEQHRSFLYHGHRL